MKTEFLKELGLSPEAINRIMAENGKDIEGYKTQLASLTTEKGQLETQIAEANKAIAGFKSLDIDKIKQTATEWESKYNDLVAESAKQIRQLKFDTALDNDLRAVKAKNNKAVKALLQTDKITLNEDGTLLGLKEQLDNVRKENPYLFDDAEEKKVPQVVSGTEGKTKTDKDDESFIRRVLGLPPKEN